MIQTAAKDHSLAVVTLIRILHSSVPSGAFILEMHAPPHLVPG